MMKTDPARLNEAIYPDDPTSSKTIRWNPALQALPFSPIREVFNRASGMKDVAHLSIGQPDFPTPEHIIEAHIEALRAGKTQYALDAGLPELRSAVADCYNKLYDIHLEPENVLVTTGCCQAMYMALSAAVSPGDEYVLIEPYFVLGLIPEMVGAIPRRIITTAENGYQPDPEEIIDTFNARTSTILINSPSNPAGAVYPRATMEAVCHAAADRGITVVSDEVYDRLILDDEPYASALTCSPNLDHVIVCSSLSKSFSMAGLRIGWAISSKENIRDLQRYHIFISTTENTPTQWAAVAALTGDQTPVHEMVKAYRERRDCIMKWVEKAPGLSGYRPGGAFFMMPALPEGVDSFDVTYRMLEEAGVCVIPGGAFGKSCNNGLRMSFAPSIETINKAFERMIPWLEKQSF